MADRGEILIEKKIKTFLPENSESDHVVNCVSHSRTLVFCIDIYVYYAVFVKHKVYVWSRRKCDESYVRYPAKLLLF